MRKDRALRGRKAEETTDNANISWGLIGTFSRTSQPPRETRKCIRRGVQSERTPPPRRQGRRFLACRLAFPNTQVDLTETWHSNSQLSPRVFLEAPCPVATTAKRARGSVSDCSEWAGNSQAQKEKLTDAGRQGVRTYSSL